MPSRTDRDVWPDNLKEVGAWVFFIVVIFSMGILWYTDRYFIHQFRVGGSDTVADPGTDTTVTPSGDALYIAADDAA